MNTDKPLASYAKMQQPPLCEPRTDMKVHLKHGKKQERGAL